MLLVVAPLFESISLTVTPVYDPPADNINLAVVIWPVTVQVVVPKSRLLKSLVVID